MTRIEAPSRLHFGLLSLPGPEPAHWPDGSPVRQFGGVGLMIDAPGVAVRVVAAKEWQAIGPSSERALGFARKFSATLPPEEQRPFHIGVERCPEEHIGLGVGTSLGLAVAKAIACESGRSDWSAVELARRIRRGERSAIGIHGFDRGGLIVEAGKLPGEEIAPLVSRYDFPDEWRVVLVRPKGAPVWHGPKERLAFAGLAKSNPTETLCRIVVMGMLPALAVRDFDAFGEALHEYNLRAGEGFSFQQGGMYAGPAVAELVACLRKKGVRGVGQSSWGPTVFAVVDSQERADDLAEQMRETNPTLGRNTVIGRSSFGSVRGS